MAERAALLVAGAAARDIDRADARGWRLGGTVAYAALAAARLGVPVRALVGVDAPAADARELDLLRGAGVELELVPLDAGPVFENIQYGERRRQIAHHASARIPVGALPASWRRAPVAILGPVADEIGPDWADALPATSFVALAGQGILRELSPGEPVRTRRLERTALVARADALFVSAEDVSAGAAPLAELLLDGQELFVTHGGQGALMLRREGGRLHGRYVQPRPRRVPVDTTGTGDVFLATYAAARLAAPSLGDSAEEWRLTAVAAGAASLNVTAHHLEGVPSLLELCAALVRRRP